MTNDLSPQLGGQHERTGNEPGLGGFSGIVPIIGYNRLLSMTWEELDNMTAAEIGQAIHEVEVLMMAQHPGVKNMVVYKLITGDGDRITDDMIALREAFKELIVEIAAPVLRLIVRILP